MSKKIRQLILSIKVNLELITKSLGGLRREELNTK